MQEQGTWTECVYCTKIRPDIGAGCPVCGGKRTWFQPARMMDAHTSGREVLQDLFMLAPLYKQFLQDEEDRETGRELWTRLTGLLQRFSIYHFDCEQVLMDLLLDLESRLP
ncbi:MAG: hypothetical protein E4H36_14670 [Spirochaetales bacterium]|nr:MAG: hypothetical protein E4H36_14670 [Spirochaetales bacterium]